MRGLEAYPRSVSAEEADDESDVYDGRDSVNIHDFATHGDGVPELMPVTRPETTILTPLPEYSQLSAWITDTTRLLSTHRLVFPDDLNSTVSPETIISANSAVLHSATIPETRPSTYPWKGLMDPSIVPTLPKASTASVVSSSTYFTAHSMRSRNHADASKNHIESEFSKMLFEKKLLPIDSSIEQNWSGRGQHTEFQRHEQPLLNEILRVGDILGSSGSTVVQSVQCKRIRLARKTIRCHRHFPKDQAIDEVAHLEKVKHSHIIRVIGTYSMGKELSILLYPATEYNLETFIESIDRRTLSHGQFIIRTTSLSCFSSCLIRALAYLHEKMVKHMDIKPKNLLVRDFRRSEKYFDTFKIYIADFGIARSYSNVADSETEGPTSFTRKYAAPEVFDGSKRGFPVDVFSLGCVLIEIIAALQDFCFGLEQGWRNHSEEWRSSVCGAHTTAARAVQAILEENEFGNFSYQANIPGVKKFMEKWLDAKTDGWNTKRFCRIIMLALDEDPSKRPSASEMVKMLDKERVTCRRCCRKPIPDPLEAAPLSEE